MLLWGTSQGGLEGSVPCLRGSMARRCPPPQGLSQLLAGAACVGQDLSHCLSAPCPGRPSGMSPYEQLWDSTRQQVELGLRTPAFSPNPHGRELG